MDNDVVELPIKGGIVLVDKESLPIIQGYGWRALQIGNTKYAKAEVWKHNKRTYVYMHRLITGAAPGVLVDHADRNGLNNTRDNLRECLKKHNMANQAKRVGLSSKYKGVYLDRSRSKWASHIQIDGERIGLGRFDDEREAAREYDRWALDHFGEFALTNQALFPGDFA